MKPDARRGIPFPRLGKRLYLGVLADGLRGLSLWGALTVTAWSVGNALFIMLSPPWWAPTALGLALLSLAPAFFFTSVSDATLVKTLRILDEGTTIEAALSPGVGPASRLIADRARAIDESIPFKAYPRRSPFRGMGRFWLTALAGLVVLELLALVVFHKPIIVYRPPETAAGSGLVATDSGVLRPSIALEKDKDSEERSQAEPRKENLPTGDSVALSQEELQAAFENLAQSREARLAKAEGDTTPGAGGEAVGQSPGAQKGETAEGNGGGLGEPQPGDTGSRAKGKNARGQGYEGSDSGLPPSPLVDYRAQLFKALTERGGQGITTGESLDMAVLRNYQRRFFGSFAMDVPLASHEDTYTAMLKLRWRNLGEAFR